jgi:PBP1b-binding outer membrane lipoprotein LpoB
MYLKRRSGKKMKKVLFMLLCCTVFVIGCKKAPQDQVVTTEQVEATTAAPTDVLVSSNSVDVSSATQSQGEVK